MNKAVNKIIKSATRTISKYSPQILAGLGVASIVSTAVLAAKAAPKAHEISENAKDQIERIQEKDLPEEQKKDDIREVRVAMYKRMAKLYWKPVLSGAIGATSIILGTHVQNKRHAALASAYMISVKELADFKEAARELKILNKNNEQRIKNKIVDKKVEKANENKSQIVFTGKGEDLFIDDWSGQIFKSSTVDVERAVNEWNAKMLREDQVTLNDLYYLLNIPEVPAGDLGFESGHGPVEVIFGSSLVDDKAYITMGFDRQPMIL